MVLCTCMLARSLLTCIHQLIKGQRHSALIDAENSEKQISVRYLARSSPICSVQKIDDGMDLFHTGVV